MNESCASSSGNYECGCEELEALHNIIISTPNVYGASMSTLLSLIIILYIPTIYQTINILIYAFLLCVRMVWSRIWRLRDCAGRADVWRRRCRVDFATLSFPVSQTIAIRFCLRLCRWCSIVVVSPKLQLANSFFEI
jgi:hypothetical protein